MKIKFNNGTTIACSAPTEQKMFKNADAAGWILSLTLFCSAVSNEIDEILVADNICSLMFLSDDGHELFSLSGYNRVSSSTIRFSESVNHTNKIEIQLTKGV